MVANIYFSNEGVILVHNLPTPTKDRVYKWQAALNLAYALFDNFNYSTVSAIRVRVWIAEGDERSKRWHISCCRNPLFMSKLKFKVQHEPYSSASEISCVVNLYNACKGFKVNVARKETFFSMKSAWHSHKSGKTLMLWDELEADRVHVSLEQLSTFKQKDLYFVRRRGLFWETFVHLVLLC